MAKKKEDLALDEFMRLVWAFEEGHITINEMRDMMIEVREKYDRKADRLRKKH